MRNSGLFSTLFIEELKEKVVVDDAAQGRMATLGQAWLNCNREDADALWSSFLKQALGYLEFVPPASAEAPSIYRLFEDWGFSKCISILYLAPPDQDLDDTAVGRFYPARLLTQLKKYELNWGILTNGSKWRLYSTKSTRPYEDYVELSLETTLNELDEKEYGLFERFFHLDSFAAVIESETDEEQAEQESNTLQKCRLDHDRNESEQILDRKVKTPFLTQVDEVLQYICNGFIYDTHKSGEEYTEEERAEIFDSAVKLIYRCLFLFYAEARKLLLTDPEKLELYQRHSIQALCQEAHKFQWGKRTDSEGYDLWKHLKGLISAVNEGDPEYGIMGYNGGLFDDEEERFLGAHQLRNDFLSRALYLLAYVEPLPDEPEKEYAIPYEDLEVRHLGELYENILEYTVLLADADRIRRRTKKGVEIILASQAEKKPGDSLIRKGDVYFGESALEYKQTGAYYTPESLVRFLNYKSIYHPLSESFDAKYRTRFNDLIAQAVSGHELGTRRGAAQSAAALVERFVEEEVLNFKVCDPAMGSGHFLVDAANQVTGLVIALLAEIPYVEGITAAVTSNPNYWRRLITRHCIYGVDLNPLAVNLARLSLWLNSFASEHKLTFIDHHLRCGNSLIGIRSLEQLNQAPKRKKDSKKKGMQQQMIFDYGVYSGSIDVAAKDVAAISHMDEDDTAAQKDILDAALEALAALRPLADLYTAYLMDPNISDLEYRELFDYFDQNRLTKIYINEKLLTTVGVVDAYRARHHYFHWPLEFPDVFGPGAVGGFSAVVGSPPWDILKLNYQKFFLNYEPDYRSYKSLEAKRVIKRLIEVYPHIAVKWEMYTKKIIEINNYCKELLNYKAIGKHTINYYMLFLEQFYNILIVDGYMGAIVPSGIYTDQGCQPLREMFFEKSKISFLYCFENRYPTIFNTFHGTLKVVVFGIHKLGSTDYFNCAFMKHNPEKLPEIDKTALKMNLESVKKFSPETLSLMEFKSQKDIDITEKIYGDWPLVGEKISKSWNIEITYEVNMGKVSYFFTDIPIGYPLYEGRMVKQFDSNYHAPTYWLKDNSFAERIKASSPFEARVVYSRQSDSHRERTLMASIVPSHTVCEVSCTTLWIVNESSPRLRAYLCSLLNSFILDYILRQKITLVLNMFFIKSLPLPRIKTTSNIFDAIVSRAIRLLCDDEKLSSYWASTYQSEANNIKETNPQIDTYGPVHEQEIRKRLYNEASSLTPVWGPHCGVHDRLPDRRDIGDRAQLRAEIDAYIAHLYNLSRDDFSYILDTFPLLKKNEEKAFGEFMSKRKCLEEYDRIKPLMEGMN